MRKSIVFFNVVILVIFLTSCTVMKKPIQQNGVNVTTNDVLNSQVFNGVGIQKVAGGQLLRGLFTQEINKYMDRQDAVNLQNAILTSPVGKKVTWQNNRRKVSYTVRVLHRRKRTKAHLYCRVYETIVIAKGETEKAIGTVCKDVHGHWHLNS